MKLTSINVRHFKAVEDSGAEVESGEMSYGFASNLRDALPNASFIGFTATPIQRQRRGLIPAWGNAPGNGSEMG